MAVMDDLKADSCERLRRMVTLLGFSAEITAENREDVLSLALKTDDAGRLIGRKGHCLQSLELLLQSMIRKQHGECPPMEIVIDGYRRSRRNENGGRRSGRPSVDEERLEAAANDAAKEVTRWGEERSLGPYNAAERRVIHMTLRDDPSVDTESSEPDENGRKRIIVRVAKGHGG